ncbi:MAG: hypothetical protein CME62_07485 [Halobacteriovoraceae bacterium]|nr:hypothetical protein [Halobacteriovoraceae bacterium]|tara:strand:- start:15208 stop:16125 length:918 start_codon:yes stop_codon:yes gene_type:complete
MAIWRGKYITGAEGTSFCLGVAKEQDQKSIKLVNHRLKTNYENYQPWMSHVNDIDNMRTLSCLKLEKDFMLDENSIKKLDETLSINGQNLKRVHAASNGKIGVLTVCDSKFDDHKAKLEIVLDTIKEKAPSFYIRLKNLVSQIVLQTSTDEQFSLRTDGTGLSSFNYRRGVFISIPSSKYWEVELILNLWHECGHQALITLQLIDSLVVDSHFEKIYSVIRKTDRPVILSFHAVVAIAYMVEFLIENKKWLSKLSNPTFIEMKIQTHSQALIDGLEKMKKIRLSSFGNDIYKELLGLYLYQDLKK